MENLELALEDCLQRLAAGTASPSECLARYPQYAKDLRPMLETAALMQRARNVQPSNPTRERMRAKVTNHIQAHRRLSMRPLLRLAVGAVALALTLFFATTAFAQSALPGQGLYQWKLSTEQAWRAASPDPVGVDLTLAQRRTDELLLVAGHKQPNTKDDAAESEGIAAYNDVLNRLSAESVGSQNDQVLTRLQTHQEKLSAAGIHVPELDELISHGKSQQDHGKNPAGNPQP